MAGRSCLKHGLLIRQLNTFRNLKAPVTATFGQSILKKVATLRWDWAASKSTSILPEI